jgi:hypothetical protein
MNKFTDKFFAFPIKIYDSFSLKRSEEYEEDVNMRMEADWISGIARVPVEELYGIMWNDGYSNGRTIEDVKVEGFDLTIIYSERYGELICTWPRKKFEDKLNDFMARQPEVKEETIQVQV